MKPAFSVILPVYFKDNAQHFDAALQSLFEQSLPADEVVVIKDGPLSAELELVLKKWQASEPALRTVALAKNLGLSAALNAGINAASHPWLARMDADDICRPDRFEKQLSYLEEHPEISILGSWIDEFEEEPSRPVATRKLPETHEELLRYAKWRCPFNHMTVLYKKSVLLKLGAYKDYGAVGDDYELWARFLVNGYRAANIQESLVYARATADFFKARRRGLKYFKNELREINDLYRLKLIGPMHYLFHLSVKAVVRLSPPALVKLIYKGIRKTS